MKPCPRCHAVDPDPCLTASGKPATSWHKARTTVTRDPRHLELTLRSSVEAATWLTPADQFIVEAIAELARSMDDAIWKAEKETEGSLFAEAPLADMASGLAFELQVSIQALGHLGLTPAGRKQLRIDDPEGGETDDAFGEILAIVNS